VSASPKNVPQPTAEAPALVLEPEEFSARNRSLLVALRSWRAAVGISREDLAVKLGCGLRTLDTWLNGEAYPRDPAHLKAITNVTGITFDAAGEAHLPGNGSARQPTIAYPPAIQKAAESIAALMRDLQPIIRGPPALRRGLREVVNREDAGYLKAAMEALYSDEETFQTWKHFAHPSEDQS
jgi:transcriptional regulator with XRE-family HTH domain